jgi:hypothetical protein
MNLFKQWFMAFAGLAMVVSVPMNARLQKSTCCGAASFGFNELKRLVL